MVITIITTLTISLSLLDLLKEAEQNNPEIRATKSEYEAYALRVNPAKFPQDPFLFLSGKTAMWDLGIFIEQVILSPKKFSSMSNIASMEAILKLENIRNIRISVLSEVSKTYFEYSYLVSILEISKEIKDIYQNISKVIAANYSVGKASLAELSRILSKISQVQTEINNIRSEIESLKAKINYLVGTDVAEMIEEIKPLPYLRNSDIIRISESEIENSPMVKIAKAEKEIKRAEKDLAKAEYYPDFSFRIGGTYSKFWGTGIEVMVGISIPVYSRWKQSQILASKQLEEKAYEDLVEKMILETKSILKENSSRLIASLENIKFYQEALSYASISVNSTLYQWTVGKLSLTDLLTTITEYLEIKMGLEREKKESWKAFSEIIRISGLDPIQVFKEVGM